MPRIRTIKPEFWRNKQLATLDSFTRLVAIALLNVADDDGYFEADPALIRGDVFPYEQDYGSITVALRELSGIGYVVLRECSEKGEIGFIPNFAKHQVINKKNASKLSRYFNDQKTAEPENSEKPRENSEPEPTTVVLRENYGSATVVLRENSLPEQGTGNGNRELEMEMESLSLGTGKRTKPLSGQRESFRTFRNQKGEEMQEQEAFNALWDCYNPKGRIKRDLCRKLFRDNVTPEDYAQVMAAAKHVRPVNNFVLYLEKFLDEKRWTDSPESLGACPFEMLKESF